MPGGVWLKEVERALFVFSKIVVKRAKSFSLGGRCPSKTCPQVPGRGKTVRLEVACLETEVLVRGKRLVSGLLSGPAVLSLPGVASLSSKEAKNCLCLGFPQVHAIIGRSKFVLDYAND